MLSPTSLSPTLTLVLSPAHLSLPPLVTHTTFSVYIVISSTFGTYSVTCFTFVTYNVTCFTLVTSYRYRLIYRYPNLLSLRYLACSPVQLSLLTFSLTLAASRGHRPMSPPMSPYPIETHAPPVTSHHHVGGPRQVRLAPPPLVRSHSHKMQEARHPAASHQTHTDLEVHAGGQPEPPSS